MRRVRATTLRGDEVRGAFTREIVVPIASFLIASRNRDICFSKSCQRPVNGTTEQASLEPLS